MFGLLAVLCELLMSHLLLRASHVEHGSQTSCLPVGSVALLLDYLRLAVILEAGFAREEVPVRVEGFLLLISPHLGRLGPLLSV